MSTPKQLAEKIGIEYHQMHVREGYIAANGPPKDSSWDSFLVCTHEICEDSRTLIAHLEANEAPCNCIDCAKEPVSHE